MASEDDLGLVADGVFNRWKCGADAGVVRNGRAVLGEGDVEVHANEDVLVFQVEIADRELGHVFCLL
jgi:hypothetical protein